jgi:hypothetical protein
MSITAQPDPQAQITNAESATEPTESDYQPNGGAAAALVAAGIGLAVFGIDVVLTEASRSVKSAFTISTPVGSLAGKTTFAIVIWLGSWAMLHALVGGRDVDLRLWLRVALILVAVGVLCTFPPFFALFAP